MVRLATSRSGHRTSVISRKATFSESLVQQRAPREQRNDMHSTGFDGLAAAFLAIDEDQAEGDFAALALDGVDGLEGGTAGGDDVVDDDDVVSRFEIAFDLFADAMAFGSLRTVKTCSASAGFFIAEAMPTAREMGSAPRVMPPMASILSCSEWILERTACQPRSPMRRAPKGSSAVTRQSM